MDDKDRQIGISVAIKAAVDNANSLNVNLGSPEGQAWFEETFSYLTESLFQAIASHSATEAVIKAFPGTQVVSNGGGNYQLPQEQYQQPPAPVPTPAVMPQWQQPQQQTFMPQLRVKGQTLGPLPDWLISQAAEKGVTEVYDNRDRAMGTKRPWFKATTGGDNAAAFWPPRD